MQAGCCSAQQARCPAKSRLLPPPCPQVATLVVAACTSAAFTAQVRQRCGLGLGRDRSSACRALSLLGVARWPALIGCHRLVTFQRLSIYAGRVRSFQA